MAIDFERPDNSRPIEDLSKLTPEAIAYVEALLARGVRLRVDGTIAGGVNLGGKKKGGSDLWGTDPVAWKRWDDEFHFTLDAAADETNHLTPLWLGPGGAWEDALAVEWCNYDGTPATAWLNPPFSRVAEFAEKANGEAAAGRATTVMLCKLVTDTKWWHRLVWDERTNDFRPGVRVRFIKGRVKFVLGAVKDPPPFPVCLVIFRAGQCLLPGN